jgi:hypothetical protein
MATCPPEITLILMREVPAHIPVPQVAEYKVEEVGFTVICEVVSPVFQTIFCVQPDAVIITSAPKHTDVAVALSTGVSPPLFTVTSTLFEVELVQEPAVQIAVYEVLTVGATTMEFPV